VASDVAAEGLDLQRAERIIHYDLPWTAMRLAQREGRSRRLGARHSEVEVMTFTPPDWLERRLHLVRILRSKHSLAARAGLAGTASPWRWRQDLAARWEGTVPAFGAAAMVGQRAECLVGVVVSDHGGHEVASGVALLQSDGSWNESSTAIATAVDNVSVAATTELTNALREIWRPRMAAFGRTMLRRAREGLWSGGRRTTQGRALLRRLQGLARTAAQERALDRSRQLEGLIAFAARGHTAGEELQVVQLLASDDPSTGMNNGPGASEAVVGDLQVKVVAAIVFDPA